MIKIFIFVGILLQVVMANAAPLQVSANHQFFEIKNLLKNPGFEFAKADWAASGGTATITTTAANVAEGARAYSWDASATLQYVTSTARTLSAGYYGNNCLAKVLYKTAESTVPYVLEALDGSDNVLGSQTLNAASIFTRAEASFICPSSGSVKLRVRTSSTVGNPAVIYLDAAYIGLNYLVSSVSQANHYGGATWSATASCTWSTTSNSFANFSADTDCTSPSSTNLQGNATAPSTKVPGITFTSLPPGRYMIVATGDFSRANTSTTYRWRFHDGTTASNELWFNTGSATAVSSGQLVGWLNYTVAQSNLTIQLQARNGDGSTAVTIVADTVPYDIQVYRFPIATEQVVSVDQAGWKIDANISGANPSLGTSAVTSYAEITNGSLTLTQNAGSATAWIPCSTTNDSSGTTCSAGNESIGVSFTIPYAGDYLACVSGSWQGYVGDGASPGLVATTFQVVETPNAAQTISQQGKSRVEARVESVAPTTLRQSASQPIRVCGNLTFTSAGRKTVRLMYEQEVTAVVNTVVLLADASGNNGQRDIHWEVYPVQRAWPMPIVVGGVSSNTTGQERVERAELNCDASSAITSQSGSWLSAIGNRSSAACSITIATGIFSATPVCTFTVKATTVQATSVNMTSATAGTVYGAGSDYDGYLICMGPK